MHRFTQLFHALDGTTRTRDKIDALVRYFREVPPEDAAWAVWFLTGNRPRRALTTRQLRSIVGEVCGLEPWLVEECYDTVGDLGETLALLLDTAGVLEDTGSPLSFARFIEERVLPLGRLEPAGARDLLLRTWRETSLTESFLFHKLITGNFRVGVAGKLLTRALAEVAEVEPAVMAHRLMGKLGTSPEAYTALLSEETAADRNHRPYPFFLAHALDTDAIEALGPVTDWQVEPKWDGIRVQGIHRAGEVLLWSRGEERIEEGFPEIKRALKALPEGCVVDGELLAWKGAAPLPFSSLQRRLGRKTASREIQRENPVALMLYDLLEFENQDLRELATEGRRQRLEQVFAHARERLEALAQQSPVWVQGDLFQEPSEEESDEAPLLLSPLLPTRSWNAVQSEVDRARGKRVEGVMLKRKTAPYGVGRKTGAWWKWKVAPLTMDAVLVAAQQGHGRRASLFTDYTFAVWHEDALVTVAKAYSGLSNREIEAVDRWVRGHTTGRRGPVRLVAPERVFELAFEGIQTSSRHKSGVALRFPRILRLRDDKPADQADTLEHLQALLEPSAQSSDPMQ